MTMRVATFPLLLVSLLALAGCGQTGELYFDEAPPADQLPPSRKQASESLVPVPASAGKPAPATPAEAPAATPAETPVGAPSGATSAPTGGDPVKAEEEGRP